MKRSAALLIALTLCLCATAGTVGAAEPTREPITIEFLNWGGQEAGTQPAFEAMIEAFMKENPDIVVKSNALPYSQVMDNILIRNASDDTPDVAQVMDYWMGVMHKSGVARAINDVIAPETIAECYPSTLKTTKFGDEYFSLPWGPSPMVLFYNKTLLQKAGYQEPAKTFDGIVEQAVKIAELERNEAGNVIYGLGIPTKKLAYAANYFIMMLKGNGGQFVDENGDVTLNTPAAIDTLNLYNRLLNGETKVIPAGADMFELRNLFGQGQMGFAIDGDYAVPQYISLSPKGEDFIDEIGITTLFDNEGNPVAYQNSHALMLFQGSKHPELAARFMEYATGAEGLNLFNENGGGKGSGRTTTEEIPYFQRPENGYMRAFVDAIQLGEPLPAKNAGYIAASDVIVDVIQRVGFNNESAEALVPDLQAQVDAIYQKNK